MKTWKLSLIGIVSGFLNGLLGAGGGTIIVPALEKIMKFQVKTAHATAISIILPLSLVSSYFYFQRGQIDLRIACITGFFGIFGGWIGAKLLKMLPPKIIKIVFSISMIALGVRQIWK